MSHDPDAAAVLSLEDLRLGYGGLTVLDGVDCRIQAGDYLAVVGPNGGGKSTLLRACLGLMQPLAGAIRWWGRTLAEHPPWQRIGYLPQYRPERRRQVPAAVAEVVACGLLAHPQAGDRAQRRRLIDQALVEVGVGDLAGAPVATISGGQLQRVLLARALVARPEVLILDEPATALDPQARSRFYQHLDRLNHDDGVTVILVTHDIDGITDHARSLLYLDHRQIYYRENT